ncbi:hypothetical protein BDW59DRAFT_49716 [Aspergillus cavernicola]|uniref:Glycine zipper 2TM domain-containing protein n=1 Tax=Aspergillus cavernicola TaxID=176166 RepID=A0ABR4IKZ6_9EURO
MSDLYYTQQQSYSPNPGRDAAFYAPPESQYQYPVPDHPARVETQPPHQEQGYYVPGQPHYDAYSNQSQGYTQAPEVYRPQTAEKQNGYLGPSSAVVTADSYQHDNSRLSPHYEPRGHLGSNADYYDASSLHERSRPSSPRPSSHENRAREDEMDKGGEGERGIGGALVGGATGYYLGHKKRHGLLGALGGALLGNFLENKMEKKDDRHSSHHGRRHHHHGHHRSRSRHSHRSTGS